jgi:hypothetical protein
MVVAEPRSARLAEQLHEAREAEAQIVANSIRLDNGEADRPSLSVVSRPSAEVRGAKRAQPRELDPVRGGKDRLRGVPLSVVLDLLSTRWIEAILAQELRLAELVCFGDRGQCGRAVSQIAKRHGLNLCINAPGGQPDGAQADPGCSGIVHRCFGSRRPLGTTY